MRLPWCQPHFNTITEVGFPSSLPLAVAIMVWLLRQRHCPRASPAKRPNTRSRCGTNSRASLNILFWSYRIIWPITPCALSYRPSQLDTHRTQTAGPKIAAIFSIVESCRRLGLPVRQYLAAIPPGLASRSIQSLDQLTPTAYAASKAV